MGYPQRLLGTLSLLEREEGTDPGMWSQKEVWFSVKGTLQLMVIPQGERLEKSPPSPIFFSLVSLLGQTHCDL